VREKVRLVAQLGLEIEEHQDRLKIIQEHLKSVQMELIHTQSLVKKFIVLKLFYRWMQRTKKLKLKST